MIKYQEKDYEDSELKTINTFFKIFQDKPRWPLRIQFWQHQIVKNGTGSNAIQFLNMPVRFRQPTSNYVIHKLCLDSNSHPHIIQSLQNCRFPHLVALDLKNNKIESVQVFWKVDFPQLTKLNLSDNHITTIVKGINKTNCAKLSSLSLYANNIVECWSAGQTFQTVDSELVLGVNYMVDLRWVNKLKNPNNMIITLDNNRSKAFSPIDRWAIQKIML